VLFFSVSIAYLVPIFGYISNRTVAALDTLSPVLEAEPARIQAWRSRVCRKPVRWLVSVLLIGGVSGVVHNLLLYSSASTLVYQVRQSAATASVVLGTVAIWIVAVFVVAALLDNALMLNRAARCARVQLFDTHALRPFATIAVISILALIGAQAAFPIMFLEDDLNRLAYIPGLLAMSLPMLLLAALPVWPVHKRITVVKRQALSEVNRRIGMLPSPDPGQPETLRDLAPLLTYRREVAQISEWPFDVGVATRLGLYLIIPPLTWVGAALIENVVEALL
jgi:hypothetical protein